MNNERSLVFPSSFGYRFTPTAGENERHILEKLVPMKDYSTIETRVKPLVRVEWFPGNALLKQGLIFIVGITTHGISHPVHRGGYSAWCVSTVIQIGMRPTEEEAILYLDSLKTYFFEAINSNTACPEFYSAFRESVSNFLEKDELSIATRSLSKEVENRLHTSCINNKIYNLFNKLRKNF